MLVALEEMADAQMSVSYLMHFSLDPSDIHPKTPIYLERGTNDAWKRYLAAGNVTSDPALPHIMERLRLGTDFTVSRDEFVDDATWYATDYYKNVMVPSEFEDIIYSQVGVKDPRVVDGVSLGR